MKLFKLITLLAFLAHCSNFFTINAIQPETVKTPKMWSILICTLEERKATFKRIYSKLKKQISKNNLKDKIEILAFSDDRQNSVGYKRNALLKASKGKYVSYVDDDDDVHENYIKMIYDKLTKNPDCVSLKGIITTDGENPKYFIHSLAYKEWFEKDNVYYRPPNHLNPVRRSIALKVGFPEVYVGEDHSYSMGLVRSKLLKHEEIIDEPYYFYIFKSKK